MDQIILKIRFRKTVSHENCKVSGTYEPLTNNSFFTKQTRTAVIDIERGRYWLSHLAHELGHFIVNMIKGPRFNAGKNDGEALANAIQKVINDYLK
jgi:hypothetical protein